MPLRVPRPASSSPPARWRAFVRRPSGRLASTRHTSATEARRSLAASFTSFGCGSAMSAVCAFACHRPSIHHLRPSATVAAWHPGPAAPFRGKASIPPGVVSTGSGAAVRRDLPGFASACFHPCPENGPFQMFLPISSASTGPASSSAEPDHASVSRNSNKLQQEAATAPEISVTVAARSAPRQFSSNSPPSHQR